MMKDEIAECGVMCHYVDFGVDTGKVIATKKISFDKRQTLDIFEKNVHKAEHELVLEVLRNLK